MKKTITLLIPTYNELEGIKLILPRIDRTLFDDIFVIDGGSKDGTVEYMLEQNIRIATQLRKGLAPAVFDSISSMIKTDYVIEFSPDNNCIPEQLSDIVTKIHEGYEIVVVSRYLHPAKSLDDNLITAFGNWMFSVAIRFLGKFPVSDSLTIYRGYKRNMLFKHDFQKYLIGPVLEPLVSAIGNLYGYKYCEIPGDEPKRVGGESKMRVVYNGSCIALMIMRLYIRKFFVKPFEK
jgi:glycosyltransferase involved in cell wall biosynthesis